MTKDEICRAQIALHWPHRVALPAEVASGFQNSETIREFAKNLSMAPITCSLRREDHEFVVFCFAKPEDVQAFAARFGGEVLTA